MFYCSAVSTPTTAKADYKRSALHLSRNVFHLSRNKRKKIVFFLNCCKAATHLKVWTCLAFLWKHFYYDYEFATTCQ